MSVQAEDVRASVVYREGELTAADYDEAIEALQAARGELVSGKAFHVCAVCESEEHSASSCRHNPLVMARRMAARADLWKCYHCGASFGVDEILLARQHFGLAYSAMPECVARLLRAIGVGFELSTDDEENPAFVLSLPARVLFAVQLDYATDVQRSQMAALWSQFVGLLKGNHLPISHKVASQLDLIYKDGA